MLSFAKPRRYQLKNINQIPLLPWEDANSLTLSAMQLEDGDLLLFKDKSHLEKISPDKLTESGVPIPLQQTKDNVRIPEPSIIIHTRYDKKRENVNANTNANVDVGGSSNVKTNPTTTNDEKKM